MFLRRKNGLDFQVEQGKAADEDSPGPDFAGPGTSPWRVIITGEKPGDLILSNLILNLNEPCRIEDPSWIKPGISMWDWRVHGASYGDFTYGMNTESWVRFIDFAALGC